MVERSRRRMPRSFSLEAMPPGIRPKISFGAGTLPDSAPGREVERDRHAGRMADEGDALQVGLGVRIVRQGCESALGSGLRRGSRHPPDGSGSRPGSAGRARDGPCGRDGRSSRRRGRVHRTPGMQEDHHRTRLGGRVAAMEDEGSGARRADRALDHLGRLVIAPARPLLRLLRRRGRRRRWGGEGDAKEQNRAAGSGASSSQTLWSAGQIEPELYKATISLRLSQPAPFRKGANRPAQGADLLLGHFETVEDVPHVAGHDRLLVLGIEVHRLELGSRCSRRTTSPSRAGAGGDCRPPSKGSAPPVASLYHS